MSEIIEFASDLYPERLRFIEKPPTRLYVDGNIDILKEIGIAVVGSRTNTQYGEKMCKTFVKNLTEYNINVISGLALGIDGIAHKTCLKNGGKTIAVLPCGIKNIYPYKHQELAQQIKDNGGILVSEYEDDVEADSNKFLERNRIVAGLGIGTLVIEAGERSGTRVTARYTQNNGKPVFCIPSNLDNIKGKTTNELIQKGAILVTNIEDILDCYPEIEFSRKDVQPVDISIDIPHELLNVYKIIRDVPVDVNEITRITGLSISEVSYKTMMLQLENKIIEMPGQRFVRNDDDD